MNNFTSEFNILIVDDIPTNVTLVHTILKKEGYSLLTAEKGSEALDIARENHPNLILLDIMMPEMDGYEVLRRLKSNPETTDIPVMIMSALSEFKNIVKGYQLGAIEYITKPFNREELVKRVAQRFELFAAGRIKQELECAVESREMLFSMVTRELRSPIGSMKMMNHSLLQQVRQELIGPETYGLILEMNKKSEEVSLLLENMLKVTKNEYKKQKPYRQYTDLNRIVNRQIDKYEPIAELKKITFIRDNLNKELMAFIDIDMMKIVVRNLLSNAVKFSFENSSVHVSTEIPEEHTIKFRIWNKGKPIQKVNSEKVLDEGNQFSTFGTGNESGLGMGLKISKSYVESHQGELWFEAEENGESTFYFSIKDYLDDE